MKKTELNQWRTEYYVYIEPDLHNNMCYTLQSKVTRFVSFFSFLFFSLQFFFRLYMRNWKHRFSCCFLLCLFFLLPILNFILLCASYFILCVLFDVTLNIVSIGSFFSYYIRISVFGFVLSFFSLNFFFEVCPIVIFRREKERKRHWHLYIVLWLILCEAICVVQVRRLNMPVLDVNEITSHTQNLLCDDKIINKQQQGMATPVHTHAANRQRKILSFCPVRFIHDSLSLSRTHFFLSVVVDNFVVFIRIFIVIFVLFIVILASYCALNTFPWHIDSHWLCTENKEHEMESQWKNRRIKHWKMKRDVNMTRSMEFCSVASGVGNGE